MTSPGSIGYIKMIELHDYVQLFLVIILVFVLWFFITIILDFSDFNTKQIPIHLLQKSYIHIISRNIAHLGWLEVLWTIIPIIILTAIAIPSFKLLYALDVVNSPLLTLRCIGNQWYWAYECESTIPSQQELLQSFRNDRNPFIGAYITNGDAKWTHTKIKLINKELVPYLFPNINTSKYFDANLPRINMTAIPTFNKFVLHTLLDVIDFFKVNQFTMGLYVPRVKPAHIFDTLKNNVVNNIENGYPAALRNKLFLAYDFGPEDVTEAARPVLERFQTGLLEEYVLYQFKNRYRRFTHNLHDLNLNLNPDLDQQNDSNVFLTDFILSSTTDFEKIKRTKTFKEMIWPLEMIQLKNKKIKMGINPQKQHELLNGYLNIYTEITQLLDFIFMRETTDYNSNDIFSNKNLYDNFLQSCNNLLHLTKGVESFTIDSYMLDVDELQLGAFRLLETDNFPILPADAEIRLAVTGTDVIHSFAVPSLGVKIDAIPGRLNQFGIRVRSPGIYYGQCSELCGVGHGFMPIKLQFKKITE